MFLIGKEVCSIYSLLIRPVKIFHTHYSLWTRILFILKGLYYIKYSEIYIDLWQALHDVSYWKRCYYQLSQMYWDSQNSPITLLWMDRNFFIINVFSLRSCLQKFKGIRINYDLRVIGVWSIYYRCYTTWNITERICITEIYYNISPIENHVHNIIHSHTGKWKIISLHYCRLLSATVWTAL